MTLYDDPFFVSYDDPQFLGGKNRSLISRQPFNIRSLNDLNHTPAKLSLANYTWRPGEMQITLW